MSRGWCLLRGRRWAVFAALMVGCCALPVPASGAGTAAQATSSFPIYSGFHSVLAYGEGGNTSLTDLAAFEAAGTVPGDDTSQLNMYEGLEQAWPGFTSADLNTYYKNSDFTAEPSESTLSTLGAGLTGTLTGDAPTVEMPEAGVTIIRNAPDDVPDIYAQTRPEGMWAAGYVSAEQRMFLMDVLRHTAEGTLTELLGASSASADSAQLGIQDATPAQLTAELEDLPAEYGEQGQQVLADMQSYVAGINAFIDKTKTDPTLLPAEYTALGISLKPWTLADSAAVGIYLIGQETVFGGDQGQQSETLDALRDRLGAGPGTAVYDDLRMADDPSVYTTLTQPYNGQTLGKLNPKSVANITPGSLIARDTQTDGPASSGASRRANRLDAAAVSLLPSWAQSLAKTGIRLDQGESNAILVDAKRSGDGQAVAAMGPQVDYYTPEILFEYELHAPGIDVSGVSFPGSSPYPLIGHGIDFAWSGTSAYSANEDVFAEKLCNPDGSAPSYASQDYLYKGRCIPFTSNRFSETTPVAPTSPALPQTITMTTLNSVHGPINAYAMVGTQPVALAVDNATRDHELGSYIAFMRLSENDVDSPRSFISAMSYFTGSENWFYVDDKNIAVYQSGSFPQRAAGTDPDLPIWGTGQYDWKGFNPVDNGYDPLPAGDNPHSIDPPSGYLVNWNNAIAPGWRVAAGDWEQGPGDRVTMLVDDLRSALAQGPLTLANLTGLVTAPSITQDLRGVVDWPLMKRVLGRQSGLLGELVGLLNTWSAGGSQLRSTTLDGNVQYGPAALLMQTWWPLFVKAEFTPALGSSVLNLINDNFNTIEPEDPDEGSGNMFGNGFEMDVDEDLGTLLKVHQAHFSRVYCGGTLRRSGALASCRAVMISTLEAAYDQIAAKQGSNPDDWTWGTTCAQTTVPSCDQAVSTSAGAITLPPQPLDNRGTFYQAVAVVGHRPS